MNIILKPFSANIAIYCFIFALIGFTSCSPVYFPPVANVPLYTEGKQAKAMVAINGGAFDAQGSVALTDHFAIAAGFNAFSVDSTRLTTSSSTRFLGGSKGAQFDIAPGYFTGFGENGVFEVFGGYGIGQVEADDIDGNINKIFLQPSVGFAGKNFEGAFTLRVTQIFAHADVLINSQENETAGFIEPALTFRAGAEKLKFHTQLGLAFPTREEITLEAQPFIINLGIQYHFGRK